MASMDWDDYLRHEAATYRRLAEKPENVFGKQELLDLAAVCEEVANSMEDRLTGGEPPRPFLTRIPTRLCPLRLSFTASLFFQMTKPPPRPAYVTAFAATRNSGRVC